MDHYDLESIIPLMFTCLLVNMTYTEKVDVLDMIIEVLREHEKTLDLLIAKLEAVMRTAAPV